MTQKWFLLSRLAMKSSYPREQSNWATHELHTWFCRTLLALAVSVPMPPMKSHSNRTTQPVEYFNAGDTSIKTPSPDTRQFLTHTAGHYFDIIAENTAITSFPDEKYSRNLNLNEPPKIDIALSIWNGKYKWYTWSKPGIPLIEWREDASVGSVEFIKLC